MSAYLTPSLWFLLAALCAFKAISIMPPAPEKRRHYLVCYQAEGGMVGNMDASLKMPLNAERITQLREYIQGLEPVKGKTVIITSITEIEP